MTFVFVISIIILWMRRSLQKKEQLFVQCCAWISFHKFLSAKPMPSFCCLVLQGIHIGTLERWATGWVFELNADECIVRMILNLVVVGGVGKGFPLCNRGGGSGVLKDIHITFIICIVLCFWLEVPKDLKYRFDFMYTFFRLAQQCSVSSCSMCLGMFVLLFIFLIQFFNITNVIKKIY